MSQIHVPGRQALAIRQEMDRVLLLLNGKCITSMPPQAARLIAQALIEKAGLAEQWENPQKFIKDQAILDRLGIPINIVNDPKLRQEAIKESQNNHDLRKHIRGRRVRGIRSGEKFGKTSIIQKSPEPGNGHQEAK